MGTSEQHNYLNFDDFLNHWASAKPDGVALEMGDRITTYAGADRLTRQLLSLFTKHGVGHGDRIAWLGKNSDRYFLLLYAAARLGVVMAPIGWRLAPREIAYILSDTGTKLLFVEEGFIDTASEVTDAMDNPPAALEAEMAFREAEGLDPLTGYTPAGQDDAVLQLYTSGTTGNPKGVGLSNSNLFSLRKPSLDEDAPWHHYVDSDCILAAMPCAHIGGTGLCAIAVANGIPAQILAEYTPDGVLNAITNGATHMFLVPAAIQFMIMHPLAKETDFSGLRYLMYGAAPMPLELLKQTVATMPQAGLLQVYGMTETCGTVTMLPPEDHSLEGNERMRSAGKAVPGVEIQIRDENNQELPIGEIGEICILSPSNTSGYWKLPEATAKTIDPDGWLHTGDAGIMDEDGYVYIQDRIKDMIISGGENVYPAEVENAIFGHPAVAEVAVIGIPSEQWGEEVKACCVAKPGMEIDPNDVIAYTRERIAAFKAPKSVDIIAEMPRNATGKILRRELRAPYWEGQDRQVS
ncbi:MAG: long-chain-fatty-acid--CoA ligase [Pseudomonadota bacterium]